MLFVNIKHLSIIGGSSSLSNKEEEEEEEEEVEERSFAGMSPSVHSKHTSKEDRGGMTLQVL